MWTLLAIACSELVCEAAGGPLHWELVTTFLSLQTRSTCRYKNNFSKFPIQLSSVDFNSVQFSKSLLCLLRKIRTRNLSLPRIPIKLSTTVKKTTAKDPVKVTISNKVARKTNSIKSSHKSNQDIHGYLYTSRVLKVLFKKVTGFGIMNLEKAVFMAKVFLQILCEH